MCSGTLMRGHRKTAGMVSQADRRMFLSLGIGAMHRSSCAWHRPHNATHQSALYPSTPARYPISRKGPNA